jgi:prephenate dehydrogenase
MSDISVAIIGLGRIGASIGLALKRYNQKPNAQHKFIITGVEGRPGEFREMEKREAIDKQARNPIEGVRDRDIVVLAPPYADLRALYRTIGEEVRAGGVVLDAAPLKGPSITWAKEFLHDEAHLVGIAPILNAAYLFDGLDDTEHAQADLFDNGHMLLMPSASCVRDAVELATDFARLLGSEVHFVDPLEYDTLVAATDALPALLGVAAFWSLSRSSGWDDMQRFTNPRFGRLTHTLFDTHPDDLRDTWLNNRESLVRYADQLIDVLEQMKAAIRDDDKAAVEAALVSAADDYSAWINRRVSGKWDDDSPGDDMPGASETIMSGLFGGQLAKRLRGGDKGKNGR